ncbi:hypothetical protein J2X45_003375 [Caulobacter sp. BE264]|uniref:hypothetical protein n=1 Tax=Caulobacter sp. BE264 TaxID=2817724 RepID=UPI00285F2E4E|nr:hypothetical protein [Caulobacter sp. BE264]MDR7232269.1 hypothetical protein [Caulobacter sp. BE264]
MRALAVFAGLATIGLMSCEAPQAAKPKEPTAQGVAAPAAAPAMDLSTPDRALKSQWAYADWYRASSCTVRNELVKGETAEAKRFGILVRPLPPADTLTGAAKESFLAARALTESCKPDVLRREINEIKTETESRAVAFYTVYDETPIPEGYSLSEYSKEDATTGDRFKVVLTKVEGKWLVEDYARFFVYDKSWLSMTSKPREIARSTTAF